MPREKEKIDASKRFVQSLYESDMETLNRDDLAFIFQMGAKWSDTHPVSSWISVKDDLPCNHKELISLDDKRDTLYVLAIIRGHIIFSRMYKLEGKWFWENDEPTHWFPIPNYQKNRR